MKKIRNIAIIGDGGWGTTLAVHLARKNYAVTLWGPFAEYINQVNCTRINIKFLPGILIPPSVNLTSDLTTAVKKSDLIVLAVPSQYFVDVLRKIKALKLKSSQKIYLSVIKGIDYDTGLRMSQLIRRELGNVPIVALSGPTIAAEVAKGIPTTAVASSQDMRLASSIQKIFNSPTFRIYTNPDLVGVELGGSLKNIIAIACGVCDGLGFGTNTKAAILTRGLVEMGRLGAAMGAKAKTFAGLTGLGDLVTTCVSSQSRNRSVGEQLGKGKSLAQITENMNMVAEGVETVKSAYRLSRKYKIPMPITSEVYNIIYKNKSPQKAVEDLMTREIKAE
jgi:glycerol-3-phosphate dehydrogenase (NAD(P)+)